MSRRLGILFIFILVTSYFVTGCSEDTTAPRGKPSGNPGLVEGNIDPNASDFEFTVEVACDPGDRNLGLLVIRGTNIHYESSLGALVADITVTNLARCSFPEPIWLTFVDLLPEGVTVLNPDNGEHGPGAAILFEFENDDGMWTPHEESIPHEVQFGIDPGKGVGFVARIDVGADPSLGTIGGVVWNDVDEDGEMDPGEPGIGGHFIMMQRTDGPDILWRMQTANDGSYKFEELHAGHYQVTKEPLPGCKNTTPTVIQVLLVEHDGQVSDFLEADFGCVPLIGPIIIEVGDGVEARGEYAPEPHRVKADTITVYKCWPGGGKGPNETSQPPCIVPFNELMGPVTDLDLEGNALAVMGTWVVFLDSIPDSTLWWDQNIYRPVPDLTDIEIGDRVRVRVSMQFTYPYIRLIGVGLWDWPEKEDRVHGQVEQVVVMPPPVRPSEIMVLGTRILISERTHIIFRD